MPFFYPSIDQGAEECVHEKKDFIVKKVTRIKEMGNTYVYLAT